MMNSIEIQPNTPNTPPVSVPEAPQFSLDPINPIKIQPNTPPVSVPEAPQFPLDPTNPIVWILVITALLGNTDEVLHGLAEVIRAIASLKQNRSRTQKKRQDKQ